MNRTPFKLKSGNTTSFKMMGSTSPVKAMDVLLDGVSIGTGDKARAIARDIEYDNKIKKKKANKKEIDTNVEYVNPETTGVAYTGADALVVAKQDGASPDTMRALTTGKLGTDEFPYYRGVKKIDGDRL